MGKQILLVDDSATVQQLVRLAFSDDGLDVAVAATAADGENQLDLSTPDLILVDALLPDCHGFEFLRRIRSRPQTSETPIILLASAAAHLDVEKARMAGAESLLAKPFESIALLVETVREALQHNRSVLELSAPLKRNASKAVSTGPHELGDSGADSILELDEPQFSSESLSTTDDPAPPDEALPETVIENIANRVASRLSGQLTREVARNVVPEVVSLVMELLAKKTAVSKSNELSDIDVAGENIDH